MIQLAVYLAAAALALAWIWLPQVRCLPFGHEPTTGLFVLPPDLGDVWLGLEARPRCAECGALVPASGSGIDQTPFRIGAKGDPSPGGSMSVPAAATAMARPHPGSRSILSGEGAGTALPAPPSS